MKITNIDSFTINVPATDAEARQITSTGIVKIETDEGITGYGFQAVDQQAIQEIKQMLVGQEPFAIECYIEAGLGKWPAVEHALWDVVGKAAGLPVYKLLGGYRDKILAYLTTVWPGAADQSDYTPQQQADVVLHYAREGFKAVKIRSWRPDLMVDVEAVRAIRETVGGRDKMEVMIDRTAQYSGTTWDYETALRVARAFEEVDTTWLEEPFMRGDADDHARLTAEVDILITGGEGAQEMDKYCEYAAKHSFDIVQPNCTKPISELKNIATIAEAFGMSCIFHGGHGFTLAASLQAGASIRSCRAQEIVFTTPSWTPQETWAPLNILVTTPQLYTITDGYIEIPQAPGLGISLDEEALEKYRV